MESGPQHIKNATFAEIKTQPQAWQQAQQIVSQHHDALLQLWEQGGFTNVIFTGCGSTYYLSLAAAALFQQLTGRPSRGVPASELLLYPKTAYSTNSRTLLVAVSRSAATTETIRATQVFKANQAGEVITITNYGDRPLAQLGAINLAIPAGQEQSVAQTRSFASMYVATTALAAILAGRQDLLSAMQQLPEHGWQIISQSEAVAQELGGNLELDRFYFLGSGPRYGLACEANLKMKEMSLTHSEPFHFLEFRHGPKSMVNANALVVGLLSDTNRAAEAAVLAEMEQLGGKTLSLGEAEADLAFASHLPESIRQVLYLPPLQLLAYYRAMAKKLNPDRPTNLEAVVQLDWDI